MQPSVAAVASGLAVLRTQIAGQGPTALLDIELSLRYLSDQLLTAVLAGDSAGADAVTAETRALKDLLVAGEVWCRELATLLSCQTQGYGGGVEPRGGSRVQLKG